MKSTAFITSILCLVATTLSCQRAALEDPDPMTDELLFTAVEDGEEVSDDEPLERGVASYDARKRHRRMHHFLRFARKIKREDPTTQSVVGFGLRNPTKAEGQETESEDNAQLCDVDLEISSNMKLAIDREPKALTEIGPAELSDSGNEIKIKRKAERTRMIFSLHKQEVDSPEVTPTLTIKGTIKCEAQTISIDKDLSAKVQADADGKKRFHFHQNYDGARLRGRGVNFR